MTLLCFRFLKSAFLCRCFEKRLASGERSSEWGVSSMLGLFWSLVDLLLEIDEGQRNYSISGGISQATYGRLIVRI